MKKLWYAVAGCCIVFFSSGCIKDKIQHTYSILTPVYKTKAEVFGNIKSNAPKEIQSPGKIFMYNKYIFLNEIDKGVHVIDNSNPGIPVEKAFIDIPGNLDLAVKGNILYADMYNDLVAIDITNPLQVRLTKSIADVFPERSYANGFIADNGKVIVGWVRKDTTVEVQPSTQYIVYDYARADAFLSVASNTAPGVAGSMARFSIVDNYLYAVDHHNLKSISISNGSEPFLINNINAGWDIETIYPFKNKLFLGSMGGVFIFDISDGAKPVAQGNFVHARACDPVVADDDYAYVTLRSGTICGPTSNELQIIDVKNLTAPVLVNSYAMTNPKGLAKDGNFLFICDGADGVKMYDASNVSNLQLLKTISGVDATDVIAQNGNLLIVAKDGLYQYDYTNSTNVNLLSKMTISK